MDLQANRTQKRAEEGGEDNTNLMLIALAVVGGVIFAISKGKKKGKKKK
jgi:LPXTG-motif cell wall-anchored protein